MCTFLSTVNFTDFFIILKLILFFQNSLTIPRLWISQIFPWPTFIARLNLTVSTMRLVYTLTGWAVEAYSSFISICVIYRQDMALWILWYRVICMTSDTKESWLNLVTFSFNHGRSLESTDTQQRHWLLHLNCIRTWWWLASEHQKLTWKILNTSLSKIERVVKFIELAS